MKKIAFINYGGIGDEILFFPTIKSVKKTYPDSEITLVLEPRSKSAKDLTSLVDNIIECNIKSKNRILEVLKLVSKLRKGHYDIVVSAGASPLVSIILFLTGIKERYGYDTGLLSRILLSKAIKLNKQQYAGNMYHDLVSGICNLKAELPEVEIEETFHTNPHKQPETFELPELSPDKKVVLLHPGSSKMSKEKNIIKSFNEWTKLIKKLQDTDKYTILLAGGPDDKDVIEEILSNVEEKNFVSLLGKTKNIKHLVRAMKRADLCVCIDSAPTHIAVGLHKKLVTIFGPTDEKKLVPQDESVTVITNNVPCRPCLWDVRSECCNDIKCLEISADTVFEAIEKALNQ